MLATTLEADPFLGRILTGRIDVRQRQAQPDRQGAEPRRHARSRRSRVTKVLAFRGLERTAVDSRRGRRHRRHRRHHARRPSPTPSCDPAVTTPLPAQPIDPPTHRDDLPHQRLAVRRPDGDKVQSRVIRDRLMREAEGNVAIRVTRHRPTSDAFEVAGRGELQLGVLIETMRREGFELSCRRPRVLFQTDPETGQRLEPIEEVMIDVDEEYRRRRRREALRAQGRAARHAPRRAAARPASSFHAPSRGLIGYHGEFLTDTRGTGVMNRMFHAYAPLQGRDPRPPQRRADLQCDGRGACLRAVQPRGARADVHRRRQSRSMPA